MLVEIGMYVITYDGHKGVVVKRFKPTGRDVTVHTKEDNGTIWYCPESDVNEILGYSQI